MVLLIFFSFTIIFELEYHYNTGHLLMDWTILQGPSILATLLYCLKVVASKIGAWIREDEKLKKEYEAENSD